MGYRKIENLYRNVDILMFRECYALEKIHGTSAHIAYKLGEFPRFFAGGGKHEAFVALFDGGLIDRFAALGHTEVTVYGESYGGSQQGMSATYGPVGKFVAFEVQVGEVWLSVLNAADVAGKLGLEFVHFERGPATVDWLNRQRDQPSTQAKRNGIVGAKPSEGVVVRPLVEVAINGHRLIVKHKRDEFRETKTPREVDPDKLQALSDAGAVAAEWVTDMRLAHVLDKLPAATGMEHTPMVISAMLADVKAESEGEIVWSKDVERAIGKAAATMWKAKVSKVPTDA